MKKILHWLDINLEPLLLAITFFTMFLLITMQVILRFFDEGFSWGEEIARYLFVWLCFLGISYSSRNNKHMDIAYLRNALPIKARKCLLIFADLAALVLFGFLLVAAVQTVMRTAEYGDMAITVAISKNFVFASAVVGYILSIFRTIQTMVWKIKRFNNSYDLFTNDRGMYSGANNICFASAAYRAEMDEALNPDIVQEEQARKGGGASC